MAGLSITSAPVPGVGKVLVSVAHWPTCTLAPTPGCSPNSDCQFIHFQQDNKSCCLCLINCVALSASPQLILLMPKNSRKKCTLYKHVMYTNYVNLQCCRWPSVDCSFRIRRGCLKFERGSHVTLITAQLQPNIPLSFVIHLCLLSLTDNTLQNSRQLKSCTTSNREP